MLRNIGDIVKGFSGTLYIVIEKANNYQGDFLYTLINNTTGQKIEITDTELSLLF